MTRLLPLFIVLLLLSCDRQPAVVAGPDLLSGTVAGIADGDTFTLRTGSSGEIRVRLNQIDAPEKGQAWSQNSKRQLGTLLEAGPVRVKVEGKDRYGRTLGRVYAGKVDVNLEMVEAGCAWAYTKYMRDGSFKSAEIRARDAGRGLWSMPARQTTAPWTYRAERRDAGSPQQTTPIQRAPIQTALAAPGFSCGQKRLCRQMTSCEEATFHLQQCGLRSIDGDGDGVPCEQICRGRS